MTYTHLPEHAYHAIRILTIITSYPIPQSHMVSYFTSNPQLTIAIRHGFVQCLEEEESTKVIYIIYYLLIKVINEILSHLIEFHSYSVKL